jgi:hypothetical protein
MSDDQHLRQAAEDFIIQVMMFKGEGAFKESIDRLSSSQKNDVTQRINAAKKSHPQR